MIASTNGFEMGTVTLAQQVGDEVVKYTRTPLPEPALAESLCDQLQTYHAALQVGPLAVAELTHADVVPAADGYHTEHATKLVEGAPLSRVPFPERRAAIGKLAETIQQMPSLPGSTTKLLTPVDARPRNFVLHNDTPVLVDICPPFEWGDDGLVKTALKPDMAIDQRAENTGVHGTRGGVMAELIMGAVPEPEPGESKVAHLQRVIAANETWYEDLIPAGFPEVAREDLSVRVKMKLVGYLGAALRTAASFGA